MAERQLCLLQLWQQWRPFLFSAQDLLGSRKALLKPMILSKQSQTVGSRTWEGSAGNFSCLSNRSYLMRKEISDAMRAGPASIMDTFLGGGERRPAIS